MVSVYGAGRWLLRSVDPFDVASPTYRHIRLNSIEYSSAILLGGIPHLTRAAPRMPHDSAAYDTYQGTPGLRTIEGAGYAQSHDRHE